MNGRIFHVHAATGSLSLLLDVLNNTLVVRSH